MAAVLERELFVFGGTRLRVGAAPVAAAPGVSRLLGFLAAGTGTEPREEVAAALWPDATGPRANTALRTSLTRLRKEVGDGWVDAGRDTIGIADGVWCDCHCLRDAVRDAAKPHPIDLPHLRKVLALYTADAFRGCYDEWALEHRQRLRQEALLGYERLVEGASAAADWDLTLEAGLSGIALDPLMESFHRGVILAHGYRGNPAAAIRQFTRLESLLASELRLRPSAATREALSRSLATARGDDRRPPT